MGPKRLAELVVQAHAAQASSTRFSMVRFGNVLGSSGSVVLLFDARLLPRPITSLTGDHSLLTTISRPS